MLLFPATESHKFVVDYMNESYAPYSSFTYPVDFMANEICETEIGKVIDIAITNGLKQNRGPIAKILISRSL